MNVGGMRTVLDFFTQNKKKKRERKRLLELEAIDSRMRDISHMESNSSSL
jgi:hypothetical protein